MEPLSPAHSGRGRSREPRSSYDDDDEDNSFESYDSYASASEDESYEPASDTPHEFTPGFSTEYESDESYSAISDSEPPTPSGKEYDSDDYEVDEDGDNDDNGGFPSRARSDHSITSTSRDEFANDNEDEYEDSFGEFNADDSAFKSKFNSFDKSNAESSNHNDEIGDSETDGNDEDSEKVKLGQTDDDLFWKRYGYSQQVGNFEDDESKNPNEEEGSSSHNSDGPESNEDDDFDDGDTFKDELYTQAFPSIARMVTEDTENNNDDNNKSASSGLVEKMKGWFKFDWLKTEKIKSSPMLNCSDVLQGNFKWYILGAIILIGIGATLGGILRKTDDKNSGTESLVPTTAPSILPLPTLPVGQVMESITIFALIANGKDDDVTEEELEVEFSAAFDILAPQILFNSTEDNNENKNESEVSKENQTVVLKEERVSNVIGLRGRLRSRRKMEASSVKLPVPVDIVEIVCPTIDSISESDMCVRVIANIILVTDDGNIGFDYSAAIEDAIEDGQLHLASDTTTSNLTIVTLDKKDIVTSSPTTTASPTISPRPTTSAAPTSSCYDKDSNCEDWAKQDPSECDVNPEYMIDNCVKSCGLCATGSPTTAAPTNSPMVFPSYSPTVASTKLPAVNSANLTSVSPTLSPSIFPNSTGPTNDDNITFSPSLSPAPSFSPAPSLSPSQSLLPSLPSSPSIQPSSTLTISPAPSPQSSIPNGPCVDKYDICAESLDGVGCLFTQCVLWASEGECEKNPTYMMDNCLKSCDKCGNERPTGSPSPYEDSDSEEPDSEDANSEDPDSEDSDSESSVNCIDSNARCAEWSEADQCSSNPVYMLKNCKLSCNVCGSEDDGQDPSCIDNNDKCAEWAAENQCSSNPNYMLQNCKSSCNVCRDNGDSLCIDNKNQCAQWAADNQCTSNPEYMLQNCKLSCNVCGSGDNPAPLCIDNKNQCFTWAAENQCSINPTYMLENCKLSCNVCERSEDEPSEDEPSEDEPSEDEPSEDEPSEDEPSEDEPSEDEPSEDKPSEDEPSEDEPSEDDSQETQTSLCEDENGLCPIWAADDQCTSNPVYMLQICKASCGACGGADDAECQDVRQDCYETSDSGECILTKCAFWAQEGECESNQIYMSNKCSKSCGKC